MTHDRYFLDNVAEWILELDRGHGIPWQGNYSSWLEQKDARLPQEERQQEGLQKMLETELEWVRTESRRRARPRARRACSATKNCPRRNSRSATRPTRSTFRPASASAIWSSKRKNLRKGYGDRLLIDNFSTSACRAAASSASSARTAPARPRCSACSPARRSPTAARSALGPSVKLAYVDQSRQSLNDKNTVWQEISGGLDIIKVGNYETPSRGYVGRFNFKGTQQQQIIGELSGGERNRVHLAKVLKTGGNVLLLDEPTNDLDIETLRALEEALLAFPGCAVVISHDRWFLDRIATHILAFEGNSQVVWFEGNYQEYVEDYKRRNGDDATQPHRIKYKKLTR